MKVIVSLAKPDGSFHEVGMNHRTVVGPYAQEWRIRKHAAAFARGARARLEWFGDGPGSLLGQPNRVTYL